MKFLALRLSKYGPFEGLELDLSGGEEGLHLIYGPNEAGKSSTLRAIGNLLFGIPNRSFQDGFKHANNMIRVGGTVRFSDGAVLGVVRRKARDKTLRDHRDKEVIEDADWQRRLGPIDRDMFETMFGLSHQSLFEGGQEILAGRGAIGELLFSAGAGIKQLRSLRQELQTASDELFLPRGKRKINQLLGSIDQAQREIDRQGSASQEWAHWDRERTETTRREMTLRQQRQQTERRIDYRKRQQEALPIYRRWIEIQSTLDQERDEVLLAEDFRDRHRKLLTDEEITRREMDRNRQHRQSLSGELDSLSIDESILAEAKAIEELQEERGVIRSALRDRVELAAKESELKERWRDLALQFHPARSIEWAESLELDRPQQARLEELIRQFQKLDGEIGPLRQQVDSRVAKVQRLTAERERQPDLIAHEPITRVLSECAGLDALAKEVDHQRDQLKKDAGQLERLKADLGRWSGTLEEWCALALPAVEEVESAEQLLAKARLVVERIAEQIAEARERFDKLDHELTAEEASQPLPSEEELAEIRSRRDEIWKNIRRGWTDSPEDIEPFAVEFEGLLARADENADRLYREAARVAQRAGKLADRRRTSEFLDQLVEKARSRQADHAEAQGSWDSLWTARGIEPAEPAVMKSWLRRALDGQAKARQFMDDADRLARMEKALIDQAGRLRSALPGSTDWPDSPALLWQAAREFADSLERSAGERLRLEEALREARSEQQESERALKNWEGRLAEWQHEWAAAVTALDLNQEARPVEVTEVIEGYRQLKAIDQERKSQRSRVEQIDARVRSFGKSVRMVASRTGRSEIGDDAEAMVAELTSALRSTRESMSRRESFEKQLSQASAEAESLSAKQNQVEGEKAALVKEAGGVDWALLGDAIQRSDHRRTLINESLELERRLTHLAEGAAREEFSQSLDSVCADELAAEREELSLDVERLDRELSELSHRRGWLESQLEHMDGNEVLAGEAETMEAWIAELETDVERYAVSAYSGMLLERVMESYRKENEGPVIGRAGELFHQLTRGAFVELVADYDSDGQAVLMGRRAGTGERLSVSAMSEGTADQLYLALRLASIESYLDRHEPIPIVLDDILVHFDDERAASALELLSALSDRTQILFFTHHRHLLELAERHVDPDRRFVHTLEQVDEQSPSTARTGVNS